MDDTAGVKKLGNMKSDTKAKSFYKMATILDCFSRSRGNLSITELVKRTNLPRTTIHRMVASLREIGLIDQDNRRGDYRLGLKMFYYGSVVLANLDLNQHAHEHVLNLHQITGEIVHLHMFDGSQMVCIEREEMGEHRTTTLTTIGCPYSQHQRWKGISCISVRRTHRTCGRRRAGSSHHPHIGKYKRPECRSRNHS